MQHENNTKRINALGFNVVTLRSPTKSIRNSNSRNIMSLDAFVGSRCIFVDRTRRTVLEEESGREKEREKMYDKFTEKETINSKLYTLHALIPLPSLSLWCVFVVFLM